MFGCIAFAQSSPTTIWNCLFDKKWNQLFSLPRNCYAFALNTCSAKRRQQTSKNISRFRCFGRNPVCCFAVAREFFYFPIFNLAFAVVSSVCVYETVKLVFKPVVNSNTATSKQYNKLLLLLHPWKDPFFKALSEFILPFLTKKRVEAKLCLTFTNQQFFNYKLLYG